MLSLSLLLWQVNLAMRPVPWFVSHLTMLNARIHTTNVQVVITKKKKNEKAKKYTQTNHKQLNY